MLDFVWQVASKNNDVQLADFIESEFLGEQVKWRCNLIKLSYSLLAEWFPRDFHMNVLDQRP